MTIYIRTSLGNEAALNPDSPLPRKLRTLLIAVDGRTTANVYVESLSSFGDVESLMASLLQAGLIEVIAQPRLSNKDVVDEVAENFVAKQQRSAWSDTDRFEVAGAEHHKRPQGSAAMREIQPSNDFQSWSNFPRQPTKPSTSYQTQATQQANSTAQHQLRNAIGLMSDFLTEHMPMESLEMVLALEGITSVEQVIGSLKGYQTLTEHLGQPARDHLAKLRTLLASV